MNLDHIEKQLISKYRERRKETESRIKRTKENLSRVKDIRDEIARLIKRLENQAKAADKYNLLKKDKAKLELDKAILFSIEAKNNRDNLQKNLDSYNRDLKIKNAECETIQSQIDQYRTENDSILVEYETAQKNFYAVGAEIAKEKLIYKILINQILKRNTAYKRLSKIMKRPEKAKKTLMN